MKIALLVDSLHSIAAGSERQIYKLAEGLVSAGHDVRLLLLRHTAFTQTNFTFPCPVTTLDIASLASWHAVKTMRALRRQLLQEQVDVVHAYFPDACLLAPLLLKSPKLRVITSRRDMGLIYEGKPAWLFRLMGYRTQLVISNSMAVAKHIGAKEGLSSAKTCVIYNGIENYSSNDAEQTSEIFQLPDSIKLILVANVKPVKRTLDAIKTVRQLTSDGYKVELALAGEKQDKAYVGQIEHYIAQEQLSPFVHWLGQVKEPRRLLKQAQIGLLISESEGLSNTIMEYMQAGLPVVATVVGGNPELVAHEENGLLIERGNVQQLVDAIVKLHENPQLIAAYGAQGQSRISSRFSLAAMVQQHERAYAGAGQ